jgi:hypothetical protein
VEKRVCTLCGKECDEGYGQVLTEFFDIPDRFFSNMEKVVSEFERQVLCREHLAWVFQILRDFWRSGGNMRSFLDSMESRIE